MSTISISGSSNDTNLVLNSNSASINDSGAVPVSDTELDNVNAALKLFGFDVQFSGTLNPYQFPEITAVATPQMVGTYNGLDINSTTGLGDIANKTVVDANGLITLNKDDATLKWSAQISKTEVIGDQQLALCNLSARTPYDYQAPPAAFFLPYIFQHLNGDTAYGNPDQENITSLDGWFLVYHFNTTTNKMRSILVMTGVVGDWAKLDTFFVTAKKYPRYLNEAKQTATISKQLETAEFDKQ
jgi:hypothetical protein